MKLSLHASHATKVDQLSEELLAEMTLQPADRPSRVPASFGPTHEPPQISPTDIVDGIIRSHMDVGRQETDKAFRHGSGWIGLAGDSFKKFEKLAESIQSSQAFREAISLLTIRDVVFKWLRERYLGHAISPLSEHVVEHCSPLIASLTIWIPIANTRVQTLFQIGTVTIRQLDKATLDHWETELSKDKDETRLNTIRQHISEVRKQYQGYAVAVTKHEAEKERAAEISRNAVNDALALLRFHHPGSLRPEPVCYSLPAGEMPVPRRFHMVVENGVLTNRNAAMDKRFDIWDITNNELMRFQMCGLATMSDLLVAPRTAYHEKLRDALLLYSRCAIAANHSDRLTAILVALESVALRDPNEPVQQTIADRVAFSITNDPAERQQMVREVKAAYGLRSAFLHHGAKVEDREALGKFMLLAWSFFLFLVQSAEDPSIKSKNDLLDLIDRKKYS
jgi:hypothetical protein